MSIFLKIKNFIFDIKDLVMLKSLYSYKGNHTRTLSFEKNEKFIEIGISRDPSWVHVINEHGTMGYIPKNYVAFDEVYL